MMIFSNDDEKKRILIEKLKTITVDDFDAFLHHKNITTMCSMCYQAGEQIIDETDVKDIPRKPSSNRFVTFFHPQPVIYGDIDIDIDIDIDYYKLLWIYYYI